MVIRWLRYGLVVISLLGLSAHAYATPKRVVTTGMCTDAWAIQLLPPERIAALTHLARNPALSFYTSQAHELPQHKGSLEDMLQHRPDLVLADGWVSRTTQQRLESLGVRVVRLPPVTRLAQWAPLVTMLGELLGVPERAAQLLAMAPPEPLPITRRVAIYHIGGYSSGKHTLEGDIVRVAGGKHLGAAWGGYGWAPVSLERLLLANPDLLVLDSRAKADQLAALVLHHPALRAAKTQWAVHHFPERAWLCLTPASFVATKDLGRVIADLE